MVFATICYAYWPVVSCIIDIAFLIHTLHYSTLQYDNTIIQYKTLFSCAKFIGRPDNRLAIPVINSWIGHNA